MFIQSHSTWQTLRLIAIAIFASLVLSFSPTTHAASVDLANYSPDCGIEIHQKQQRLAIDWPAGEKDFGRIVLDLDSQRPLIESLSLAENKAAGAESILSGVDPVTFVTVGSRQSPPGRPPDMSVWNVFFDKPASRPYKTYLATLDRTAARVSSEHQRATVAIGELVAGPFRGELWITVYRGSPLVRIEAVVSTKEDGHAILYDAGLASNTAGWQQIAWMADAEHYERETIDPARLRESGYLADRPVAVRGRAIAAEGERGSIVCFPPPHQFHFPRDWTDNLKFAWLGRGHLGHQHPFGFGIRQVANGGRAFEPWFNAPPGTQQRLSAFYLLSRGRAESALGEAMRLTHDDRFVPLPEQITFTSHWHMAVAVTALQKNFNWTPELVTVFREMGVNAVHLGEFHGDGHQKDPGPLRLPELEAMFRECRRLSTPDLLLIPGEEVNDFFGIARPGQHPGHWMSLFPQPVYWVMQRKADQPMAEPHPRYGTLYRVGSTEDAMELFQREHGLAWTAHPRIKASNWTPDAFRDRQFFQADYWLGAAWKAMPADLSRPKLSERSLDLMDDMANWGHRKYVPGEVDVFKIDQTHELYGHMNVNYLRLARVPRFDSGWREILDALRTGAFFTITGEVLIRDFRLGGKQSGEASTLTSGERPKLEVKLEWTFPLEFAEIVTGDGKKTYRERIDLADTGSFGERTLTLSPDLTGRRWLRFEVWDIAANGAYTQPIWLEASREDLSGPDFDPPDCPAWAKEKLPEWVQPYVGKNGLPDKWRPRSMLGSSVKGLDRYQANQFICYRPETAKYLYSEYTPLNVGYKPGSLPGYEKLAAQYTAGLKTDTDKAVALLNALPKFFRHPSMPPRGASVRPDRNLDDESLLATGCGWCNEQARVFIRLCQVSGIPARMIHLFGQNHTVAEFHADGRWGLADTTNLFVVPADAAHPEDSKLLSVAKCHDGGEGQRAYALAKQRRMQQMLNMSDGDLGFTSPQQARRWREGEAQLSVDELAKREVDFGVINYPLPK